MKMRPLHEIPFKHYPTTNGAIFAAILFCIYWAIGSIIWR